MPIQRLDEAMTPDRAVTLTCALSVLLVLLCEDARAWDAGWRLTSAPLPVAAPVIEVPSAAAVCGPSSHGNGTVYGCYDAIAGVIFLQAGLSATDRACMLRHERFHEAGWTHNAESTLTTRPSCGPEGI